MVGVMQVDTAPRWWFLLIAVMASAFLLAALILGATGTARTLLFHGPIYSLLLLLLLLLYLFIRSTFNTGLSSI
jgi:hypothetical protein